MRAGDADKKIRSTIFFSSASRPKKTCGRMGWGTDLDLHQHKEGRCTVTSTNITEPEPADDCRTCEPGRVEGSTIWGWGNDKG